ncbi:methyltransferase family protein [Neorhodopirellula pilleata]|uniref:NnrU protein n=1 Tax=Neorhodopirellula pilleata TaxID=2714738 RepID=A0A5C5ZQ35_9BACT|nr:NnrU family protein [Neorhodopirellula pilleata]TWT89350.1 NnrU protein [Neorhodopirellula pilleata]
MDVSISHSPSTSTLRRLTGLSFGFGNQILFLVTVWFLFWFLRDGAISRSHDDWIARDCGLAIFFAFSHSVMLVPKTRKYLTRWIPQAFYDSTFCVVTCVSLLALFFGWRNSETVLWEASGLTKSLVRICFYGCWVALFYSLALTGLGYQNGWTPFYYWLRNQKPPRREFRPRGAYKLIRHPVYLSFLGLIWFTPTMTLDHAALTAIWTSYIFYGSFLKDRRLEHFIGEPYKAYERSVPGYPFVTVGLLAKKPLVADPVTPTSLPSEHSQRPRVAA